ncbi:Serine/threonine-protein kinase haspin [Irineochytrium annulatum]|nr:Serine/threonine-protein kinase haspin [Irineochytrium annulatum]
MKSYGKNTKRLTKQTSTLLPSSLSTSASLPAKASASPSQTYFPTNHWLFPNRNKRRSGKEAPSDDAALSGGDDDGDAGTGGDTTSESGSDVADRLRELSLVRPRNADTGVKVAVNMGERTGSTAAKKGVSVKAKTSTTAKKTSPNVPPRRKKTPVDDGSSDEDEHSDADDDVGDGDYADAGATPAATEEPVGRTLRARKPSASRDKARIELERLRILRETPKLFGLKKGRRIIEESDEDEDEAAETVADTKKKEHRNNTNVLSVTNLPPAKLFAASKHSSTIPESDSEPSVLFSSSSSSDSDAPASSSPHQPARMYRAKKMKNHFRQSMHPNLLPSPLTPHNPSTKDLDSPASPSARSPRSVEGAEEKRGGVAPSPAVGQTLDRGSIEVLAGELEGMSLRPSLAGEAGKVGVRGVASSPAKAVGIKEEGGQTTERDGRVTEAAAVDDALVEDEGMRSTLRPQHSLLSLYDDGRTPKRAEGDMMDDEPVATLKPQHSLLSLYDHESIESAEPVKTNDSLGKEAGTLLLTSQETLIELDDQEPPASPGTAAHKKLERDRRTSREIIASYTAPDDPFTLKDLYALCKQTEPIPLEKALADLKLVGKLGEATFSEVFHFHTVVNEPKLTGRDLWSPSRRAQTSPSKRMKEPVQLAVKVIPFDEESVHDVVEEVRVSMALSAFGGARAEEKGAKELARGNEGEGGYNFVKVVGATVCKGPYTEELLDAWDRFDDAHESENDRPDFHDEGQLFLVLSLSHGGTDLEHFRIKTWNGVRSILLQLCLSLSAAEFEVGFEHRDLHWGNVLCRSTDDTSASTGTGFGFGVGAATGAGKAAKGAVIAKTREYGVPFAGKRVEVNLAGVEVVVIDYTLSRCEEGESLMAHWYGVADDRLGGNILFVDMRDEELFTGDATEDYQYEIYRMMRKETNRDWRGFHPKTNIFWLHYLIHKIVTCKHLPRAGALSKQAKSRIEALKDRVLGYGSVMEFVRREVVEAKEGGFFEGQFHLKDGVVGKGSP